MRPLLPIVVLCGACGDNLLVGEEQGPPVDDETNLETEVFFAPDVCSVRSWSTLQFPDRDLDMTVVPTATGAALFAVERSGGPLLGFTIDGRGEISSKVEGTIIRDDLPFTAVSAAYIDERLITAAVAPGQIEIDMIRPDLGAHVNLSSVGGTFIADSAMSHTREDRFATFGDENGVSGMRFDTAWQPVGTQSLGGSKIESITSTRYFEDTMVAYSSSSTCTLNRVATKRVSTRDFPCHDARIAMSTTNAAQGYMVYEEADKVMIADILINGHSEIADTRVLVESAHAPKIVFDGVRFWVSYIDARNDVVIGYIDAKGNLASMALEGTQPFANAYELALVGGAVWVFSVDASGAGAQRMCLRPVR